MRRVRGMAIATFFAAAPLLRAEWHPPHVASTRQAFEAEYPKATASAAAVELEALCARIGIDVVPKDSGRDHPTPEAVRTFGPAVSAAGRYLARELGEPDERVGAPDANVSSFLAENEATLEAIRGIALGRREVAWELDVGAGLAAPTPNFLGHVNMVKVLGAQALVEARRKDVDAALQTADAMWRLCEGLSSRPELMSHMMVVAEVRYVVGLLRKIDAPAFDWLDRLRGPELYEAFLVAFQNDPWPFASEPELEEHAAGMARINRRFIESLSADGSCDWTPAGLKQSFEVARSGEAGDVEILAGIASDNLIDMLLRWQRLRLDAELTALVLEARGERASSRTGEWPARLSNLESPVCPGRSYSYKRIGGVSLTFDGRPPAADPRGLVLPAGLPRSSTAHARSNASSTRLDSDPVGA